MGTVAVMRCDGCGHEQDGGRFCGRCGAVVAGPAADVPRPSIDDDEVARDPSAGDPRAVDTGSGRAAGRVIAVLGVAAMAVLVAQQVGERPTAPPPSTDGRLFDDDTGTALVLTDLEEDVWLLDLDTGTSQRIAVPIDEPADPLRQLLRVGDHVAMAAAAESWLWQPGTSEARSLGQVMPVPAADPNRLWLQDHAGGATLVDETGEVVHDTTTALEGRLAIRGVPGGLAHAGDDEVLVYRVDSGEVQPFQAEAASHIPASSASRMVWCDPACETLHVVDASGDPVAELGEGNAQYDATQTWLSDDGRNLASSARVTLDGGAVDLELHVFDVEEGSLDDRIQLTLGRFAGDWTRDGQQFLFRPSVPGPPATLQRYAADEGFSEARVDDHLPPGDFVTLPRAAVDWAALDRSR